MTALSSVNSAKSGGVFYKFLPYYLNKLRFLRPQMIMTGIFALLSYPLSGLLMTMLADANLKTEAIADKWTESDFTMYEQEYHHAMELMDTLTSLSIMAMVIGAICLIGTFVFTFVTTLRAFRYLYDRNAVDMDYSLPVSNNTRYFADLAAVFTTSIVPHFIAVMIGVIFTNVIVNKTFLFENAPALADAEMVRSIIIQCMFVGLFACIMQMAFSLLMISFCGKKAEASLYPVLINIAIPVIHALFIGITESNTYGSSYSGITIYYPVTATSPVGMVFMTAVYVVQKLFNSTNYLDRTIGMDGTLPIFRPELMIPALLLTLVFLAGAYFLIKLRRNERVGMPYVYKGMSLIIPGIIVLAVSLPLWNMVFTPFAASSNAYNSYTPNSGAWLMGLLISTFIIYVIMELISGKAFRKFHISVAKWAGTTVVCAGIAAVLVFSNGFGKANYVPAPEQVVRADLWLWNSSSDEDVDYGSFSIYQNYNQEVIRSVTEIHEMIPKDVRNTAASHRVSIAYLMRSGEIMERTYRVSDELYLELMKKAVTPTNWFSRVYSEQEHYLELVDWSIDYISYGNLVFKPGDFTLSGLLEAIRRDSEKMNYDRYIHPEAGTKTYYINIHYRANSDGAEQEQYDSGIYYGDFTAVTVYSWMDNALEYLRQHGIDVGAQQFWSAFIVEWDGGWNSRYSEFNVEEALAMSEGKYEDYVRNIYFDDVNICYNDGMDNSVICVDEKDYSFGRVDIDDPELREMHAASTTVFYNNTDRYQIVLCAVSTYERFRDYNEEHMKYPGEVTLSAYCETYSVPEQYYPVAEKLMNEGLVYKYGDPDWLGRYFDSVNDGEYLLDSFHGENPPA